MPTPREIDMQNIVIARIAELDREIADHEAELIRLSGIKVDDMYSVVSAMPRLNAAIRDHMVSVARKLIVAILARDHARDLSYKFEVAFAAEVSK